MPRRKFIARCEDMIVASSSRIENTFSTRRPHISRDSHNPVHKIIIGVLMVLLPCTLVAPFFSFRMRNKW